MWNILDKHLIYYPLADPGGEGDFRGGGGDDPRLFIIATD